MTFYIALFVFIVSVIGGLAFMIAGKRITKEKFLLLCSFHVLFLFAFLASLFLRKSSEAPNYFFMTYICSGLLLSGLAWRGNESAFLRIYLSIFIISLPMFLFSPSMLINFLLRMNFSSSAGQTFPLTGNYFLEQQNSGFGNGTINYYKITTKNGLFHKTLKRDIQFGNKVDSIKILNFQKGRSIQLRGYSNKTSYVSSQTDSEDVEVNLKQQSHDDVEYHL